jgi:hypothetical protein
MGRQRKSVELWADIAPHTSYTRERGMWAGVLRQALADYVCLIDEPKKQYYYRQARRWFESDEFSVGSFVWICDQLELDTNKARLSLMARRNELREQLRKEDKKLEHASARAL